MYSVADKLEYTKDGLDMKGYISFNGSLTPRASEHTRVLLLLIVFIAQVGQIGTKNNHGRSTHTRAFVSKILNIRFHWRHQIVRLLMSSSRVW